MFRGELRFQVVNEAPSPKTPVLLLCDRLGAVCRLSDLPPAVETLRSKCSSVRTDRALSDALDRRLRGRVKSGSCSHSYSAPNAASSASHSLQDAFRFGGLS